MHVRIHPVASDAQSSDVPVMARIEKHAEIEVDVYYREGYVSLVRELITLILSLLPTFTFA